MIKFLPIYSQQRTLWFFHEGDIWGVIYKWKHYFCHMQIHGLNDAVGPIITNIIFFHYSQQTPHRSPVSHVESFVSSKSDLCSPWYSHVFHGSHGCAAVVTFLSDIRPCCNKTRLYIACIKRICRLLLCHSVQIYSGRMYKKKHIRYHLNLALQIYMLDQQPTSSQRLQKSWC